MIHLLMLACALNVLSMEAQVGINNANPQAALDIQSSNSGVVMPLIAGAPYTLTLRHKAVTGDAVFQNSGASGDGMGHIGHDLPCSVEFEFLGN